MAVVPTLTPLPIVLLVWVIVPLSLQLHGEKIASFMIRMTPSSPFLSSEVFVMLWPFRQRLTVPSISINSYNSISSPK